VMRIKWNNIRPKMFLPLRFIVTVFFCYSFDSVSMGHSDFLSHWLTFFPSPPPPSLGITQEGAISRSARAITLASDVLHAQPRACWRDLCKSSLVV